MEKKAGEKELIEKARELVQEFDSTVNPFLYDDEEERFKNASRLAELLDNAHRRNLKHLFSQLADEVARRPHVAKELAETFWEQKEALLNRGVGKFFKEVFGRIKKAGKEEADEEEEGVVEGLDNAALVKIALLSLAANHDVPTLKRLHPMVPYAVEAAFPSTIERETFVNLLGRRHLERILNYGELLRTYLESSHIEAPGIMADLVPKVSLEELEALSRREGRTVPWVEFWIHRIIDRIKDLKAVGTEISQKADLLPEERQKALFFLAHYRDRIDPSILKVEGKEFLRHKFKEHVPFLEALEEKLEELNNRVKRYQFSLPKNALEHLAAQVVYESCASWPEYLVDILQGPSIPVMVKDKKTGRLLGRIFFTLAKGRDGKHYVVHGDYEGKEGEEMLFMGELLAAVDDLSQRHFGTRLVPSNKLKIIRKDLGLKAPHNQPWT